MRAGLVLASLALAELGFRVALRMRGSPYDSVARAEEIRNHLGALSSASLIERNPRRRQMAVDRPELAGRVSHPFFGWQTRRARADLERYLAEERMLPEDAFVIWIVGGSVAGIFANRGWGTERLVEQLTEDSQLEGRQVITCSYGMASFKQPQQLMLVAYLFSLGLRADAVVNIDGFNEVAFGNTNALHGSHPVFPPIEQWGAVAVLPDSDPVLARTRARLLTFLGRAKWLGRTTLDGGLHHSAIVGWGTDRLLLGYASKSAELRRRYHEAILALGGSDVLRGPSVPSDPRTPLEQVVDNWCASSVSLSGLCAAHGSVYVHVLQPTLHDPDSKTPTAEEIATGDIVEAWRTGAEEGYPALRTSADRLSTAGVSYLDASGIFRDVTETVYTDGCHFNAMGNQLLADSIARKLIETLVNVHD